MAATREAEGSTVVLAKSLPGVLRRSAPSVGRECDWEGVVQHGNTFTKSLPARNQQTSILVSIERRLLQGNESQAKHDSKQKTSKQKSNKRKGTLRARVNIQINTYRITLVEPEAEADPEVVNPDAEDGDASSTEEGNPLNY